MIEFEDFYKPDGSQVADVVVIHLPNRKVEMILEDSPFGIAGERWIAWSDNGVRHSPDPAEALGRFTSSGRAERMAGAILAFKDLPSEES